MLIHGGNYGQEVLDFSVNTNPCMTEEEMSRLLGRHGHRALVYPEIDAISLIQSIGDKWKIETSRLVVGNGAIDCLYRFAEVLRPDTALIIEPTFSEYRKAFELVNTSVLALSYDLKKTQEGAEALLLKQISKLKASLLILCNPNNPTGHCYSKDFIEKVIQLQNTHKGYVLIDESFRFFEDRPSDYKKDYWNLVVLTSLTKYYGIPGLRVGYLTGNYSLIEKMKDREMPWLMNGVTIGITNDLLTLSEFEGTTRTWYQEEKAFMRKGLEALEDLKVYESHGNYFLCDLGQRKGSKLNQWLLEGELPMAIRECTSFEGLNDHTIRIGLKTHKDNEALLLRLEEYWRHNHG